MRLLLAAFFGIIQGVTEFLPISSSGHLEILEEIFDIDMPSLFSVLLHIPSLLATMFFFRKRISGLFGVLARWIRGEKIAAGGDVAEASERAGRQTIIAVIVTTFVTGAIAIFTKEIIDDISSEGVCLGFLLTAAILIASGRLVKKHEASARNAAPASEASGLEPQTRAVSVFQAAIIGAMQGLGTLPGVSRSGSTISASIFAGLDRDTAGEYSFLVSIPIILAAFVVELDDIEDVMKIGVLPVLVASVTCFAAAYVSLSFLMKTIKKGRLEYFAFYLIPLGVLGLIFL